MSIQGCLFLTFVAISGAQFADRVATLRARAEGGDHVAQNALGVAFRDGKGVRADPGEAVVWFRKSAEQGDLEAQISLAVMYFEGRGVDRDPLEGVKWTRRAAEKGHPVAQQNLGLAYLDAVGVNQSDEEAFVWLSKAAESGTSGSQYATRVSEAEFRLGDMYANGRGTTMDLKAAVFWYNKSAAAGNARAKGALASMGFEPPTPPKIEAPPQVQNSPPHDPEEERRRIIRECDQLALAKYPVMAVTERTPGTINQNCNVLNSTVSCSGSFNEGKEVVTQQDRNYGARAAAALGCYGENGVFKK
jgi:TPR repeat protein